MIPIPFAALMCLQPFQPTLALTPRKATVAPGGTVSFSAVINYEPDGPRYPRQPVRWSVVEGQAGGSVTPHGRYTAPGRPGTFHVKAEREDFPGVSAEATVKVK